MAFLIRIELVNEEPVLIPKSRQRGNHFPGLDYIPGSVIRGALAGKLAASGQEDLIKDVLGHGSLISNFYGHGNLPIPSTVLRCKRYVVNKKHSVLNMADTDDKQYLCEICDAPLVSCEGYFNFLSAKPVYKKNNAQMRLVTHNRISSETGTSSGKDDDRGGANLYSAEVIERGQEFVGYLSWKDRGLRDELLDALRAFKGKPFMLGKMKGRGYGKTEVCAMDYIDDTTVGAEILRSCRLEPDKIKTFTFLQDTLFLDKFLQSTSIPDSNDVHDVSPAENGSWFNYRTIQGFNMKRGVIHPAETVATGGSTFFSEEEITPDKIKLIEEDGVGARRCEGFGVAVCGLAEAIKVEEVDWDVK